MKQILLIFFDLYRIIIVQIEICCIPEQRYKWRA